jgi:SAM-dependent methyltransferase
MRASIHLLEFILAPLPTWRIYVTEQMTAFYRWAKARFSNTLGSECLHDGTHPGSHNRRGIRHEDLTALTFKNESVDAIVCLDVMEHIPDFHKAFAECARVLRPGGSLLLSVPFHGGPTHLLRARVQTHGRIEHVQTPEYHSDPLAPAGCLCFHHFGWDVLDYLKAAGFRTAAAYALWSPELGYMANECDIIQFIGIK